MAPTNRVNIQLSTPDGGMRTESVQCGQCKMDFLRELFGIGNQTFFLRDVGTNFVESADEHDGRFACASGSTYKIELLAGVAGIHRQTQNDSAEMAINNSRQDHAYNFFSGINYNPRPPVPNIVGIRANPIGPLGNLHGGFGSHHRSMQPRGLYQQSGAQNSSVRVGDIQYTPSITVHFRLGKWSAEGKIVDLMKNSPPVDIPVTLQTADVQNLNSLNAKADAAVKSQKEFHKPEIKGYVIHRPTGSKLLDCDEIRSVEFWSKESKKKTPYWILPARELGRDGNESSDEEESIGASVGGKGRKRTDDVLKLAAEKISKRVKQNLKNLAERVDNDYNVKELLNKLSDVFRCGMCQEIIKGRAVICLNCRLIVGCEICNQTFQAQETKDRYDITTKEPGEWKCPICRKPPYKNDADWYEWLQTHPSSGPGYIVLANNQEFLDNLGKLKKNEQDGE